MTATPEPIIPKVWALLTSDKLGVVAKLDLIEGSGHTVTPVDYKRGQPRYDDDAKLSTHENTARVARLSAFEKARPH